MNENPGEHGSHGRRHLTAPAARLDAEDDKVVEYGRSPWRLVLVLFGVVLVVLLIVLHLTGTIGPGAHS